MQQSTAILLEKDDFTINCHGQLKIRHPAFLGRGGYVAFYAYHCPQCQDTKTTWSAIGLANGNVNVRQPQVNPYTKNRMISRARCIKRYPLLRTVRKNGIVTDYHGPYEKQIVNKMCCKAGLNCGNMKRC
jgi:hypothetical protein